MPQTIPHQLTENVKLLQKVALVADGKVLLLKRASDSQSRADKWDSPGGNSEWPAAGTPSGFGQYAQDAAREVKEETGIVVDPAEFTPDKIVFFNTYFDADKQLYSIICCWVVELSAVPEVTLSDEHTEYAWVSWEDVKNYDFDLIKGTFVKETVERALRRLAHSQQ